MSVSIDSDPVTKVQIILSTMQEDALHKLRKPTNVTSYKELMGSYIEQRLSASGGTNTAKLKACSPQINSFHGKGKVRPLLKRKSTEMEPDKAGGTEKESEDVSKKPRSRQPLSQKEQQELEDIVANFDAFSSEDADELRRKPSNDVRKKSRSRQPLSQKEQQELKDIVANFDAFSSEDTDQVRRKPSNDVQPNFMAGLEGFRFTVHQSDPSSSSTAASVHMEIEVEVEPEGLATTKDDSSNSSTEPISPQVAMVKNIFGHQLKGAQYQAFLRGNVLCDNSDSEDIE